MTTAIDKNRNETVWQPRKVSVQPAPAHLPRLVWEIMQARGFEEEAEIQKWLNPSLKLLRDPFSLTDMDKAVQRLILARERQEKVVVYADYDLDGTSACALLTTALGWLGFAKISFYQPKRLSEGYGLHIEAIDKLRSNGNTLLISVDLGITGVEEVAHAQKIGLDCIVTDHHLPKEVLPSGVAVINPNRGNCTSQLGHLCGTGVAFFLVLALRRTFLEIGLLKENFDPKALLDCFVIGTLTDMVPLIDENRVLVKHGLQQLAQTKRPGLRALLQALDLWGRPLTSQDVAIRFAPKLNALSRMEMGIFPIDLYLAKSDSEAHALVSRVLTNNQDRQVSQKNAETEAMEYCKINQPGSSIFVYSKNFHRGVVGLVATKLCQEYGVPTFIGSLDETEGRIVGSARMPEGRGLNVLDAFAAADSGSSGRVGGIGGGLLEQFGGHAVAAGFELKVTNAIQFRQEIESYFAAKSVVVEPRVWQYDASASLLDIDASFMNWYEHLSPFGAHFSAPIFCLKGLLLQSVKSLKGGHYRLTLAEGAENRIGLWFSPPKGHRLLDVIQSGFGKSHSSQVNVDALIEPQWNYFNGQKTLQLLIQDLRLSI